MTLSRWILIAILLCSNPARADLFVAFAQGISFKEANRIPAELDAAARRKDKNQGHMMGLASGPKPRKTGTVNPISMYCPEGKPDDKGAGCEMSVRAPSDIYMTISGPVDRGNIVAKLKDAQSKIAEADAKKATDRIEVQSFLTEGDDSLFECTVEMKGAVREWDCSIHVSQDVKDK
ncbi:MAG: hypothetical protein ABL958_15035 [Bdellovibrionia bacterium]